MGNSHPTQHKNLTKNWHRISESLLRNTLTNELIQQTNFAFESQEILDQMACELRSRAGNSNNSNIPKLIYFMQHVERNTCSYFKGSYRLQVYTQYLPFTLANTKPTNCLCVSLINTCTQLIDKHGFFRIRPNMVFLNLLDQKNSVDKKYAAKMWVNSRPGKSEVEEIGEEDQTCQDLDKLFSHLSSIQSCQNLKRQKWGENECKKIAKLSKIIKDLHNKRIVQTPQNLRTNQRLQNYKEAPAAPPTLAPVYRARFCTEVPRINSPQLQTVLNQSMDRMPQKPLPLKSLQYYSPPITLKMSSSINKTPPNIKFDRAYRVQPVNAVSPNPVLTEKKQSNTVSSQKDMNQKIVKFSSPSIPLRESFYSFCRMETSLKREEHEEPMEKSGQQEGRARLSKQSSNVGGSIRMQQQLNSSRRQAPQQTSHFNSSNLQQNVNLKSSRANSQQTGNIITVSKGPSKQNSPEVIDKPQNVSEGYVNPFQQSTLQHDKINKYPSQHLPTFIPSTMNSLEEQRKKEVKSPERSNVADGQHSALNKHYNMYLNKFKEITKIGKNETENRIASAIPGSRGKHYEQIGQSQTNPSYRDRNRSLYENSKEEVKKQKTEEELPHVRRDSSISHRGSSVMKKIEQIQLEKDLEKEKEIIKFEKQFRSGLNMVKDDQQLKKKVRNKRATFAELKMEASKILDDLLI